MNFSLSCFTPWVKFKFSSTITKLSICHLCSLPSSRTVCARCCDISFYPVPSCMLFWKVKPLFNLSKPPFSVNAFVTLCLTVCSVAQSCPTLLWPPGLQPTRLLLSMGFSRQKYWSGLLFPPPGDLPTQGLNCISCVSNYVWLFSPKFS